VQSVVSDHHGTISVVSEEGRGTTFRIELPQRQEHMRTSVAEETAATRGTGSAGAVKPPIAVA
jgi:hypothetical protein